MGLATVVKEMSRQILHIALIKQFRVQVIMLSIISVKKSLSEK
jgi:hypothetical protein